MRPTTFCSLALCALAVVGSTHAQQLVVNCDAGEDLALALEQATSSGLTWIAVEGTCEGDFEFEALVNVTIEGRNATLVSPDEGVVFRIGGPGWVTLDGFEIRSGSLGVQSLGPGGWVIVRHCEIHNNGFGLATSQGARLSVTFSDVHHNDLGVFCDEDSRCLVSSATIRDNLSGVRVEGQSDLQSSATEISGNANGGVVVLERSTANFDHSTFRENGLFHLALIDRSHASLQNGTVLGGRGDGTPLALATVLLSSAATSGFGGTIELFGDVLATDSSYLILDSARVSGDVEVVDFAELKLVGSSVAGSVLCQSGGDAVCGERSSARVKGCASARPGCSPRPSDQKTRHGELFDLMERLKNEDVSPVPSGSP